MTVVLDSPNFNGPVADFVSAKSDYQTFLRSKHLSSSVAGFTVSPDALSSSAYPFQRAIVAWALRLGRAAIFADCGLGKTLMQLLWAQEVCRFTEGDVLIVAPLAVGWQTAEEGERFGVPVTVCRSQADVQRGVNVTNYEMLDKFDCSHFQGVALDESSILKSFTGKIKQGLVAGFARTPYRSCWTATPAPNDHLELGNHAEFLGIMPSNEMIMRWFTNDTMVAGKYRLKGHAATDFWRWVASWAVSISSPSDIGFDATGYELPPLNIVPERVEFDTTEADFAEGRLMAGAGALSATNLHKALRQSVAVRAARVAQLIEASGEAPWVVWCNTNYEADAVRALVPGAREVRGSDKVAAKEAALRAFASGDVPVLVTKPSICGFGLNWQHCHNMAFVGLSYSYEQFYQSLRRSYRFGQTKQVNAHVVYAETEGDVLVALQRKQEGHTEMREAMIEAMHDVGLSADGDGGNRVYLTGTTGAVGTGQAWEMRQGDCCELIKAVPDNSLGLSVFSPPFANLYIYSDHEADMGNAKDDEEFFAHFKFLIPEIHRATVPGRLAVVHCKDLPKYKNRDGAMGLNAFPDRIREAFEECGFVYHSRVTIWKDPVIEMQRTKNHGLLYKELCKDSSGSRQGMADYLLVFRKWEGLGEGESFPQPVTVGGERFNSYVGMNPPDPSYIAARHQLPVPMKDSEGRWPRVNPFTPGVNPFTPGSEAYREWSIHVWQAYASPVWFDVSQTRCLNHEAARENRDEKHICPLQLDVIERCVALWSNPGDTVFSPFAGIGSEGHGALALGRRFLGFELKQSYFDMACRNLATVETASGQLSIFDTL